MIKIFELIIIGAIYSFFSVSGLCTSSEPISNLEMKQFHDPVSGLSFEYPMVWNGKLIQAEYNPYTANTIIVHYASDRNFIEEYPDNALLEFTWYPLNTYSLIKNRLTTTQKSIDYYKKLWFSVINGRFVYQLDVVTHTSSFEVLYLESQNGTWEIFIPNKFYCTQGNVLVPIILRSIELEDKGEVFDLPFIGDFLI